MPTRPIKTTARNPEDSRDRILQAARQEFAAHGLGGARVDRISEQAGINKRMLYHYFGNKEGLYVEVLRAVFSELESLEIAALTDNFPTQDAIRNVLTEYFTFLEGHPKFVSLLMWENLHRGRFLDAHPNLLSKSKVLTRLRRILDRARAAGEIVEEVDPRHLLVLLYGASFIYQSNRFTLRHTMDLDCRRPSVLRDGLRQAQQIIVRGLLGVDSAKK
jgi:TetR/AcrR family transcriptional regulator